MDNRIFYNYNKKLTLIAQNFEVAILLGEDNDLDTLFLGILRDFKKDLDRYIEIGNESKLKPNNLKTFQKYYNDHNEWYDIVLIKLLAKSGNLR